MKLFFAAAVLSLLSASCCSSKKTAQPGSVTQGISGTVREIKGNAMPSPDAPGPEGKAVSTTIYIYEATNMTQVDREGSSSFYKAIRSKLVQTITSDSKGRFSADLPTGTYSLFTKTADRYYANTFDSHNNIAPVTVTENKVTEVNITISANASY